MDKKLSEEFPRSHRIVRSIDYRTIYKTGKRIHSENFVLFFRVNEFGYSRLGITVSRKIGSAVVRNRTKRLFREVFRTFSTEIPDSLDLVVNAKSGCAGIGFQELRREFVAATGRITRNGFPKGTRLHD